MAFLEALYLNPLLFYALIAGILSSIVSGVVGSYVVTKRIVFISGSIAHSILGGLGLAVWLEKAQGVAWASPLLGALLFGILSALVIGWIHLYYREREDTVIAATWSIGMAAGILFLAATPGFSVELANFMIGNILWASPQDLLFLSLLDIAVVLLVIWQHKRLLIVCFDEEQARLQGLSIPTYYLMLLCLISVSIVLLIQVVGIILVMTLLTIPPAIGNLFTERLSRMMMLGVLISAFFTLSGTALSFYLDWPSGATIALVAGIGYVAALTMKKAA